MADHGKPHGELIYDDISSTLPMFSQLRKFTLCGTNHYQYRWHGLPKVFHSAFFDTLKQSPLKEVSIERISDFPLSLLDNCEAVRSLTLNECGIARSEGTLTKPGFTPLGSLSIQVFDGPSLGYIATWVGTHGVRSLRFSGLFRLLPELLSGCANTLTDLNLNAKRECASYIF